MKYPFQIIAGDGLGVSYSSQDLIGDILESRPLGAAEIQTYCNITTGNLVIFDRAFKAREKSGLLTIQYVYNSFLSRPLGWQLNLPAVFHYPKDLTDNLIFKEKDGHVSNYTYDAASQTYVAPVGPSGTPFFQKLSDDIWKRIDPTTGNEEYYNSAGRLRSQCDVAGRTSTFVYEIPSGVYLLSQVQPAISMNFDIVKIPLRFI